MELGVKGPDEHPAHMQKHGYLEEWGGIFLWIIAALRDSNTGFRSNDVEAEMV